MNMQSRIWSTAASEVAAPAPVWAKPGEVGAFVPWGSMAASHAEDAPVISEYLDPDAIRAQAFAEGLAEGRRSIEAEIAAEREAIARLAETLENLKPEAPRELGLLLADTVKRLVRQIVGEVRFDDDQLLARAHAAAELIADEAAPVRMRLHPDDHQRLQGAKLGLDLVADSHLAPGTILLETGDGWIEDGPDVRLDRLRAALDTLGVPR